jgi:hypothetical protein
MEVPLKGIVNQDVNVYLALDREGPDPPEGF